MASLVLQPGIIPSSTSPPEMPGGVTIPRWFPQSLRRLYWLGIDGAGYLLVAPSLNRVRRELKLPPVRRFFRWWFSDQRVIGLFPDWYAAHQPDWPQNMLLAGFGRFDGTTTELPEDVHQFCADGPPPIAFTLGTGMMHASEFFRAAVQSCESLGARGLLLSKFPEVIPEKLPPTVGHCYFAPFRKLLPLCGAIVHHGGIGTTSAALESGCPQLILPLAWDQPDNGARVTRLGAGLSLGPRRRTAKHLSEALARLLSSEFQDRRHQFAKKSGEIDGLHVAAQCVEELGAAER
jgi:UDP:flavonoid glycosyltransferase YjiC (YdhE family)